MKLSIVTINYNNAEGLRKTLASVASQTYADIEHVIVDGGSTDESVEIIREYARANGAHAGSLTNNCHQIHWLSEPDNGIYHAMNKGIEIALGQRIVNDDHTSSPITNHQWAMGNRQWAMGDETNSQTDYLQSLNSGDILAADDVTERMVAAMEEKVKQQHQQQNTNNHSVMEQHTITVNENTASRLSPLASSPIANSPAIFYGNMIKEWPDGRRVKDTCGGGDYTPESFYYFYRGTLNHDCAYIRKDLFEKYGLYNEQMKICSDWEWYVRAIVLGGEKTVYTNIDVTVFDMTGISESDGKNRALIQKERREYLESILPAAVLRDYDLLSLPIEQYRRLKKYHLWGIVYFVERILFKLEKMRSMR